MPINNENDKKLSDIPDNPSENIEEDSNNCEGFFENRQTNSSEITNETLPRAKTQYENDILINLVKQFGLNDKTVINPKIRISLWIQVTKEFNRITGYDWDRKRLKNRWKNYRLHNKETFTIDDNDISQNISNDEFENIDFDPLNIDEISVDDSGKMSTNQADDIPKKSEEISFQNSRNINDIEDHINDEDNSNSVIQNTLRLKQENEILGNLIKQKFDDFNSIKSQVIKGSIGRTP